MTCGVYQFENIITNQRYIGQSAEIEDRYKKHIRLLELGIHHSIKLQKAWDKYGRENFIHSILTECPPDELLEQEGYYVTKYNSHIDGYNMKMGGVGKGGHYKTYYRIIRKGTDNGKKRYALITPERKDIFNSIYKDILDYYCELLNSQETEEEEAINMITKLSEKRKKESLKSSNYDLISNLGINYLINQAKNGLTQKDIRELHNIPRKTIQQYLKENNTTWAEIIDTANMQKIQEYDEQYNIQEQLNNGKTVHEVRKEILCTKSSFKKYRQKHNIRKPHKKRKDTNTGIRYVTLLSDGTYNYRKTNNNPNKILRNNIKDLEQIAKERQLEWIIDDEEKYLQTIKECNIKLEINRNKKIGKRVSKEREKKRKSQNFHQIKALKAFRKMFPTPIIKKSEKINFTSLAPLGVCNLKFNRGDNCWEFKKPDKTGKIQRKNIFDLYDEVKKQGYEWYIENKEVLHQAIKEGITYQEERKKPYTERKEISYQVLFNS